MAIEVKCDKCEGDLNHPGGLAFSPPTIGGQVVKFHLCIKCWTQFMEWVNE